MTVDPHPPAAASRPPSPSRDPHPPAAASRPPSPSSDPHPPAAASRPPSPSVVVQLIAYGYKAVAGGLAIGSGGNLSAREPGADAIWVTASGTWLDELLPEDFSLVGVCDGEVRDGNPRPSSEVQLHLRSYQVRPDVNALIHLHPQTSVLLDAMGHQISLVTLDHAYYVRQVRSTPYIRSGTAELADAGAEAIRDGCNCVILGHHGCSVVADTVELAYKRVANLEEAARATYAALLLGGPVPACPPEYLEAVRRSERGAA